MSPVSQAPIPKTFWKKSGSSRFKPNKPKPLTTPMMLPAENERDLKTRRSTKACGSRNSRMMKKAIPTTETIESSTIVGESNQSTRCPRSSTYCKEPIPAVIAPSPIQSAPRVGFLM